MKKLLQILPLFCFLNSFAQTIIKVETYDDDEKNKYFLPHLIDEKYEGSTLGSKDSNGFYNLKYLKLDSLKTFRLYLDDSRFLKIDIKLNLNSNFFIIDFDESAKKSLDLFAISIFLNLNNELFKSLFKLTDKKNNYLTNDSYNYKINLLC